MSKILLILQRDEERFNFFYKTVAEEREKEEEEKEQGYEIKKNEEKEAK